MNRPPPGQLIRWGGRSSGDRGAALTETALLAPWFFLLVFGVLEFGMAFRDSLSVDAAAQYGARTGAIQGDSLGSDYAIVTEVLHYLDIAGDADDVRIVVFNATDPHDVPSVGCQGGTPQLGVCNVYGLTSADDPDDFGCTVGDLDAAWCPTTRNVTASASDYLGVWVTADRPYITGLFGDSITLTSISIVRIEPQAYS